MVHLASYFLQQSPSSLSQLKLTADLLQQLPERLRGDHVALEALSVVNKFLRKQPNDLDKKVVMAALTILQERKPDVITELYDFLKSTASGAAGSVLASWIVTLTSALPK